MNGNVELLKASIVREDSIDLASEIILAIRNEKANILHALFDRNEEQITEIYEKTQFDLDVFDLVTKYKSSPQVFTELLFLAKSVGLPFLLRSTSNLQNPIYTIAFADSNITAKGAALEMSSSDGFDSGEYVTFMKEMMDVRDQVHNKPPIGILRLIGTGGMNKFVKTLINEFQWSQQHIEDVLFEMGFLDMSLGDEYEEDDVAFENINNFEETLELLLSQIPAKSASTLKVPIDFFVRATVMGQHECFKMVWSRFPHLKNTLDLVPILETAISTNSMQIATLLLKEGNFHEKDLVALTRSIHFAQPFVWLLKNEIVSKLWNAESLHEVLMFACKRLETQILQLLVENHPKMDFSANKNEALGVVLPNVRVWHEVFDILVQHIHFHSAEEQEHFLLMVESKERERFKDVKVFA